VTVAHEGRPLHFQHLCSRGTLVPRAAGASSRHYIDARRPWRSPM